MDKAVTDQALAQEAQQQNQFAELYAELDFSCDNSTNIPPLLKQLNISLAFTSYQAGRLMLVRSDGEQLNLNFKNFPRPMGLAATEHSLTLGTFTEVLMFQREDGLLAQMKLPLQPIEQDITAPRIKPKEQAQPVANAQSSPQEPEVSDEPPQLTPEQQARRDNEIARRKAYFAELYAPVDAKTDACFISRSAHYTGMINIHDIAWGNEGLWAVNSSFSCICTLEPDYSFVPRWKPWFISELQPEDRCHLNGMTLKDGVPAYVTTFSQYDTAAAWRHHKEDKNTGTLIDVQQNRIVVSGLMMPHSPRYYQGKVYFCNSGEGQLCCYNPQTGQMQVLAELPGFTRGMDFYGPLLFVGLSKVRQSEVSRRAPLAERYSETHSGIWVWNLETNTEVGWLKFSGNVDQIYDVAVLPCCSYPELIEPEHPRLRNHFCFPELQPMVNGSN
jgi:uncharacterized protein (TIGR03032 family)